MSPEARASAVEGKTRWYHEETLRPCNNLLQGEGIFNDYESIQIK
ncbi:MAG TPA: hypothetical protein VJL83_01465 [Patescibacteria group bacterium]|nr:hypothetical protein [Patescibacteria group bacterium]